MSGALTLTVVCTHCGKEHVLRLDASGHYVGALPCDTAKTIRLQVDPQQWRAMLAARQAVTRH